jgi:hypothetical protein
VVERLLSEHEALGLISSMGERETDRQTERNGKMRCR